MEHASYEDLRLELTQLAEKVIVGGLYRHYKQADSRYKVNGLVVIEADDTMAVRYAPSDVPDVEFVRPVSEWLESVDLPDGSTTPRFTRIDDL